MTIDVTSLTNRRQNDRWNRLALGDLLERNIWSHPDKEAVIGAPGAFAQPELERVTYREANDIANRIGNALLAAGLSGKDRVVMVCENSVEAYLTKLGIAKAGLVAAPLNPNLAPDVLVHILARLEPSFVIADAECWSKVAPGFKDAGIKLNVTIPFGGDVVEGTQAFADFWASGADSEPDVVIHGDDVVEIEFTSGTTAMPKGAMLSHIGGYMAATSFALSLTRGLRIESDLRLCTFLPIIYHIGGHAFALPVLISGGTMVLGRKVNADAVVEAVSREACTALWAGSPAMLRGFTESLVSRRLTSDARSLKMIIYGWAAISPGLLGTLKSMCGDDLVVTEIFGQTEAIACHRFWPDKWRDTFIKCCPETNYVGVPSPLLGSHIMDEDGKSLEGQVGVVGEAVYRSPTVMLGYYKDEEATRAAFAHGWFHSGDSCMYDQAGLRIMVDRKKDIVKTGGENVSSLRVEAVLMGHGAVDRAAVVGLPDERWGEAVTAVVLLRPEHKVEEEALIAHCRARLGGFETPKRIVFVDRFPETVGGKIQKHILRAQLGGAPVMPPAALKPVAQGGSRK
jgi:acyl-CoA synthetase (AMP-forming)/AMP-acid ligase II